MNGFKTEVKRYPDRFIAEVLRIFPNNEVVERLVTNNDERLGSALNDSFFTFTPSIIVSAFEASYDTDKKEKLEQLLPPHLFGLYIRAKREQDIENLFGWFLEFTSVNDKK